MAEKLTGAQIIVRSLIDQGVDTIFGYPGGAVLNIYDALYAFQDKIRHVTASHEQGAAHAADGYARSSGKTGVVLATSGPGATNTVTGIATAYLDSIPMVILTGNVTTELLGRDSFQEVDIAGVTMPITKHNWIVRDVSQLADTIEQAFIIANSGRPGPVLIDIPKDVTAAVAEYTPRAKFRPRETPVPDAVGIETAAEAIRKSQRPLIYAGGGVISGNASQALNAFSKHIHAPVSMSAMGLGAIPWDDARCLGMIGMHGTPVSNKASQECDLLIAVGSRFSDRVASNRASFAKNAQVLHIDIDATEISKNVAADLSLQGDAKTVLEMLQSALEPQNHGEWMQELLRYKALNPLPVPMDEVKVHPYTVLKELQMLLEDPIIVTDVGNHQMMTAQFFGFSRPRSFLSSLGFGTMGYGLGAAIGAQVANPDRRVVLITGDGSFHMNMNEMAVAVSEKLPVMVMVMNNSVLGMVREWQRLFYQERFSCTSIERHTNFVQLAEAFGAHGFRIEKKADIRETLRQAAACGGPCIVECVTDRDDELYPIIPPGGTADDIIFCADMA